MAPSGYGLEASPAQAHLTAGVELADSWATDGHKWLQTPYDSGFAIVRDAEAHRRAMAITASYLPPAEGAERDPSAYVPELSRRARGFAAWAMIRQFGREGVADDGREALRHREAYGRTTGARCPASSWSARSSLNQFMVRFG